MCKTPFSTIFNHFFRIPFQTCLEWLQPVSVADCLFLGPKTRLDWTCEHYVTQCELAANPLSSYIPTNAWQIWWTELLTDNYFQKKVSLTPAMVPWETPDIMVAAFHGHPQAGCKQEPSCVGIFDLMHYSASVSLVHRQNPQCEGQNLRTVLFKQYQDKRICARLTGRSPFNMVHTC